MSLLLRSFESKCIRRIKGELVTEEIVQIAIRLQSVEYATCRDLLDCDSLPIMGHLSFLQAA